jgi:type IV pilus assembly protein PilB
MISVYLLITLYLICIFVSLPILKGEEERFTIKMTDQPDKKTIKDILIESGEVTDEQIEQIEQYAAKHRIPFTQAAQKSGVIKDQRLIVKALATSLDLTYFPIREKEIDQSAAHLLNGEQVRHYGILPVNDSAGFITFAVPLKYATNLVIKDDLKRITNARGVEFVVSAKSDIDQTIEELFRVDHELEEITKQVQADKNAENDAASTTSVPEEVTEESKVARFVDLVLNQAVKDKASDIHFDPQERGLQIRYRIDGLLFPQGEAPPNSIREITSRIKVMADLDIADTRKPQDGRLSIPINGKKIDFRIATLPSVYGEKIVMRILDNSSSSLPLTALGFSEENFKKLTDVSRKPYGAVLVTGPTGSGKSTTLYSLLNSLNESTVNIITAEDPVEYRLKGITQIQVNKKQGLSFAAVLRTVLRADPDIILVGEIRDQETAEISLQAAMTGHMVFSTLHTNDAASALSRLEEMGVEGFMVASTLEGVVSQRLIRKLCRYCKTEYVPDEIELLTARYPHEDGEPMPKLYKAVGCKECKDKGFSGRMGIHEVLIVSEKLREAIIRGASSSELNDIALSEGMISMRDDGFDKVRQGLTTIDEINRVVS